MGNLSGIARKNELSIANKTIVEATKKMGLPDSSNNNPTHTALAKRQKQN